VTVTLTAVDNASGVDHTIYQIASGDWQTYTTPITITTPGMTTVGYHSIDVAGNEEDVQIVTVKVGMPSDYYIHLPVVLKNN
jgi:hypothetical protein